MKRVFGLATLLASVVAVHSFAAQGEEVESPPSAAGPRALIDQTLSSGSWNGELGLAFRYDDADAGEDGHAGWGFLEFDWESGSMQGLQLGVGGLAILEAWDKDAFEGIFDEGGTFVDDAKWTDAYLKYTVPTTKTEIVLGRKKFKKPASGDGDVHQGIQLTVKDIPNVTLYASAVNEWMDDASTSWDFDGIQEDWVEMDEVNSGNDGMGDAGDLAYTLMARVEALPEILSLTPYLQYQKDVATSIGFSIEAERSLREDLAIGFDGAYVKHFEDTPDSQYPDDEDVSQYLLHAYGKLKNATLGFGYYHMSNDISLYNSAAEGGDDFEDVYIMDEFDPMEEDLGKYGEQPGTDTFFLDASYSWRFLELKVVYGWCTNAVVENGSANEGEASELNIVLGAQVSEALDAELAYVYLDDGYSDATDGDRSMNMLAGVLTYSF